MRIDSIVSSVDIAVPRVTAGPRHPRKPRADAVAWGDRDGQPGTVAEQEWLRGQLLDLAADRRIVEAVEVASPGLTHGLSEVAKGEPVTAKALMKITPGELTHDAPAAHQ